VEGDLAECGLSTEQMLRDFCEQAKSPGLSLRKNGDAANAFESSGQDDYRRV